MNPTQHWLFVVDDWLLEFGFDVVVVCLLYLQQLCLCLNVVFDSDANR